MPSMTPTEVLKKHWGYDAFRPLQLEIIESVLQGCDTLGLLPTGGGKSLTFQVPALMMDGLTVVVTPLISLMKDQVDNLHARGIRAGALYSGMRHSAARLVADRCALGKIKILYVAPERLQSSRFMADLRTWNVSMIVVDEAHCISQWGHDFRPSYRQIGALRAAFPLAPVLALTASATPQVADDIVSSLDFRPGWQKFAKSFHRDNLNYIVRIVDDKAAALMRVLTSTQGTAIVYVRSRQRTVELAALLTSAGVSAEAYHAGLQAETKEERQERWKSGQTRVMVATNAFGMGIDKPDVRLVVHYDLPSSLEEYYQEAGRGGRDGLQAFAVVITTKSDKGVLTRRLADSFPPREYIRQTYSDVLDFLSIAPGDGYNAVRELDVRKFCSVYNRQPLPTLAALKLLGLAGYMEFIEDMGSKARVMVVADKRDFYTAHLSRDEEAVLTALLRSYSGLFADFVPIEETAVSLSTGLTADAVYQALLGLDRKRMLTYVPKRTLPYIYLPTAREESRHLLFPIEIYEHRRAAMEARIDAMKRFVFDSGECRSVTLLSYFGEKNATPCGRCDVCRARASVAPAKLDVKTLQTSILALANRPGGCDMNEIIALAPNRRESLIELARRMADAGQLRIDGLRIYI